MKLVRVLLAEDYPDLRRDYVKQIRQLRYVSDTRFMVSPVSSGNSLYQKIRKSRFNIIVSDTDLPSGIPDLKFWNGDQVCRRALDEGLIDKDVLILAMSYEEDNQQYWSGVVNHCCFYNKANLTEGRLGQKVLQAWNNFNQIKGWKEKMPIITY
jgi:CheY-like chemotaxis protein